MERMTDYKPQERQDLEELYRKQNVRIYELREENKKLKEENEYRKKIADVLPEGEGHIAEETIQDLQKEIKSLKLENAKLKDRIITDENFEEKLDKENKKLKEKVETLELWLDNKEKLNEEYRDKIDLLKYQSYGPSELADSLYDANKTIEKLKEEIKEIEKNQEYRYHRCMKAEGQVQHSLGGDDELIYEEGLYD